MSSPDDSSLSPARKNPRRACQSFYASLANKAVRNPKTITKPEDSSLAGEHFTQAPPEQQREGDLLKKQSEKNHGRKVAKHFEQQQEPHSDVPAVPLASTRRSKAQGLTASNGLLRPLAPEPNLSVPQRTSSAQEKNGSTRLTRVSKEPSKGRKKKVTLTSSISKKVEDANPDVVSNGTHSEKLDCGLDNTDPAKPQKGLYKRASVRSSKRNQNHQPSSELFSDLKPTPPPEKDPTSAVSDFNLTSAPRTPKRSQSQLQPNPCLSSTPTEKLTTQCLSTQGSETAGPQSIKPRRQQSILDLSPVKAPKTEVALKSRGQLPKSLAASKPEVRRKRKGREDPGAPPTVKRNQKRKALTPESVQQNQAAPDRPQRCRPRFEPQETEIQEPAGENLSSDLSIELSPPEDPLPLNSTFCLSEEEEEDQDDDEELPSFLLQMEKKPLSITEGLCVWCKLRKYPFWPAMVKSVNHKSKKASIVFIDGLLFDKKRIRKGFSVSLRTLKPFDCEEAEQLVGKAKEKYGTAITWCLELISDYRIRVGCGSFVGSFIEYFADDISCPVRMKYPQGHSDLAFPSQLILKEQCQNSEYLEEEDAEEETTSDQLDEQLSKKVLPDRTKAARNRANKKLIDFIVKKRGVEKRLLAVLGGQETSKWLQALLKASRSVVDTYLEDEEQVDQLYTYLNKLYDNASKASSFLASMDRIRFILDVLLPEAIIHSIAVVEKLPLEKAEEKYRKGPCFSNRERQEFDMMIEQQMRLKAVTQCSSH
ncbi:PWWP domain-containing DNA repair factor 3A [Chanos chanos]|uniref:PWWP domain-containing DNA repair factor 3A n=1 Tax=Chanos chanos TaxID=29144 RepID=A0A6J2VF88_CHACN|nr:PWWP domain-containing DNA repair factor 3A-like [Chanos chanos]